MKKVIIGLLIVGLLFVLLVGGVVVYSFMNSGKFFKMGIEKGGTYATGVETTVDSVEVSLFKGTFDMSGFELANPAGFTTPHFLALGDTAVALNTDATNSQTITLATLTLTDIDVYLDKGGDPSNYNTILESLKRFESGEEPKPDSETSGFQFVIDSLIIENVDVHLANMPGVSLIAGDVAVNVPQIELQNIGADDPMSFGEIIGLVVKTVLAASVESGGGIIPADILGDLSSGLGSLTSLQDMGIDVMGVLGEGINGQFGNVTEQAEQVIDDVKNAGEDLQNKVDDVTDQAEDAKKAVEDAADDLKGIFGGKKDDP